jgi:hypothetical protein
LVRKRSFACVSVRNHGSKGTAAAAANKPSFVQRKKRTVSCSTASR